MLVGYMRISSADDRQSVNLQHDALLAAGVDERHLHQDKMSCARGDRPGLKGCPADLRRGDVLVVWKLDRLGRSLPHLLDIMGDLKKRGVMFRSLTDPMHTTTPHGELMFSLFGALAQYERALTRERVQAGLAAARRRGRHGGRPLALAPEKIEAIIKSLDEGNSITVLPDVMDAVGRRVPVIFDSGIRRGIDVFRALALGATAVGVGRPVLFGAALGGAGGMQSVLQHLNTEFRTAMLLAGVQTVGRIGRDNLLPAALHRKDA